MPFNPTVSAWSGSILLLALTTASGCDKIPGLSGDKQAQAEDTPQAASDPATPAAEPGEAAPSPTAVEPGPNPAEQPAEQPTTPEPTQPEVAPAPPSEFDGLLVRTSGLADPKQVTEPSVEQDNSTAWTHYKAKQWTDAAKFFARVAARDPAWKHAHNLACASAMAGKPDDARIALIESLRRGGDEARASANKDSDLASVRTLPWFAELLAEPTEAPRDHGAELAEEDDEMKPPPNCPPEVKEGDDHYCLFDMLAEWKFEELVFTTPVSIDLEIPERPAKRRWKKASKIPWSSLRDELGITATTQSNPLSDVPPLLEWSLNVIDESPFESNETQAFFWWPEDNTPVLVVPHKQKAGKHNWRFKGVILAKQTESGWRAINFPVATTAQIDNHLMMVEGFANEDFESDVLLRFDDLELFTLTQFTFMSAREANRSQAKFPNLCRIRWEQGKLQFACTDKWTNAQEGP